MIPTFIRIQAFSIPNVLQPLKLKSVTILLSFHLVTLKLKINSEMCETKKFSNSYSLILKISSHIFKPDAPDSTVQAMDQETVSG